MTYQETLARRFRAEWDGGNRAYITARSRSIPTQDILVLVARFRSEGRMDLADAVATAGLPGSYKTQEETMQNETSMTEARRAALEPKRAAVAIALRTLFSIGPEGGKEVRIRTADGWSYAAVERTSAEPRFQVQAYAPGDEPFAVLPMAQGFGATLDAALAEMWVR